MSEKLTQGYEATRGRRLYSRTAWRVQRFMVEVLRPDGSSERYERLGGSSIDHTLEGMDAAGLGGVVRVVPIDLVGAQ